MIHLDTVIAILVVALTTYSTRVLGYMLLKHRTLSPRQKKVLDIVPGCVLISVLAPYFVPHSWVDLLAITATFIVSIRFSLLPAVVLSMLSTALLRMTI
ncbi:AzlD family protein [Acinetobacter apis]|uniref:Uncharacterized membrane protein n=1 Tax=Acinetobacter apis TaxID=1229165 RepID=A0A217EF81_9GAMM|nr:AzlD family protein [Acinetobacter apis]SNQ28856.1 Uncharacterized membrane protein [Acinetobacter apis]